MPTLRDLTDYAPHLVAIARTRLEILAPLLDLPADMRTRSQIAQRIAQYQSTSRFPFLHPSIATIYRWIATYEAYDRDIRALIPRLRDRGGRTQGRVGEQVEQVIQHAIANRYLVREMVTIDDIWHEVAVLIAETNQHRSADQQLACPSRRTIARRIAAIPASQQRQAKQGAAIARQQARQVGQTPYPTCPLARVEMDHLTLDLITVDEQDTHPLGRLTLTYCLDTATCYPLGYFLSFEPPSYWSVMECLYHALFPKPAPDTQHPWLASGLPAAVVVDQGKEFIGQDLTDACTLLGITLLHAPVRTPEFKGRIERHFRTVNGQLIHTLPGTTFSNARARGDYASLKEACLTLADVDRLFVCYLLDIYAQSYHRGMAGIPARRWEILTQQGWHPRPLPHEDEAAIFLGRTAHRCVHAYGIELFGLRYNAPMLGALRDSVGHTAVKIKYHPGNLGSIAVYHPDEQRYLMVPAIQTEYAVGLPLWKHQIIKRLAHEEAHSVDVVTLGHAKQRLRAIVEQARTRRHRTRKIVGRSGTLPTPTQCPYQLSDRIDAKPPPRSCLDLDESAWGIEPIRKEQ
jgi:putative transposase